MKVRWRGFNRENGGRITHVEVSPGEIEIPADYDGKIRLRTEFPELAKAVGVRTKWFLVTVE